LLDKGDQGIADGSGEGAGTSRRETQDLEAMGQRTFVTARAAILDIIVDRMIVGGDRLESGEMCFGHCAARDIKSLSDSEILKITGLSKAMPAAIEILGHGASK
jgi:hypothetical protein